MDLFRSCAEKQKHHPAPGPAAAKQIDDLMTEEFMRAKQTHPLSAIMTMPQQDLSFQAHKISRDGSPDKRAVYVQDERSRQTSVSFPAAL